MDRVRPISPAEFKASHLREAKREEEDATSMEQHARDVEKNPVASKYDSPAKVRATAKGLRETAAFRRKLVRDL